MLVHYLPSVFFPPFLAETNLLAYVQQDPQPPMLCAVNKNIPCIPSVAVKLRIFIGKKTNKKINVWVTFISSGNVAIVT